MKHARLIGLALVLGCGPALALPPETSLRPTLRPAGDPGPDVVSRAVTLVSPVALRAPDRSLRPTLRPTLRPAALKAPDPVSPAKAAAFARWIEGFKPRARAKGLSNATLTRAFAEARYRPDVIKRDQNQSEFVTPIWDYLARAASDSRIENGRAALRDHGPLLDRIEARYGVEKEVVVAVWGMESAYGTHRGDIPVIEALATLAYDGRRGRFFEGQLIAALQILQRGDTTPAAMKGSWAGAMGHTQFIPTSFQALAVDFTGDGRRDIWGEDPADALASTANYLAKSGWAKGQPWGVEVRLPRGFDYGLTGKGTTRMPSDWARLGVTDMAGRAVRDFGRASILLPAGHQGAAFMIFGNFKAISRYNAADAYVLGVGHLSDRLAGQGPIRAAWPEGDRALTQAERKELQRRLTQAGYNTGGVDGRIGPNTLRALRKWQAARGLVPDGYASLATLDRLR